MATSGGGGGGKVYAQRVTQTTGNITFNASTASGIIPLGSLTGGTGAGQFDLVVRATAGDFVYIGGNFVAQTTDLVAFFDMQITGNLNFLSSGTPTGAPNGVAGWTVNSAAQVLMLIPFLYTVQAADGVGGNVLFRLVTKTTTVGTATVLCNSSDVLNLWAVNLSALATGA